MNMTKKFTTTNINNGEHDQKINILIYVMPTTNLKVFVVMVWSNKTLRFAIEKIIIYFKYIFLVMFNGNVRHYEFFGHVLMLMFVGVKKIWSCSNRNSVILIWSSELASASSQVK